MQNAKSYIQYISKVGYKKTLSPFALSCLSGSTVFRFFLLFIFHFPFSISAFSQPNSAARYEIDAKRIGVSPLDKDALPRSREFIRLDSTYYVGYMYEGLYKDEKSSDLFGFKNAITPLRKAFVLFERDYGSTLKGLFSAPEQYMQNVSRYIDFLQLANTLRECYDNIERPDSVMWLLDRVSSYKFPKEHMPVTTYKSWTFHRNRFYTSDKFSFLKNSVEENEKMAFHFCYEALGNIERNQPKNDLWFGPGQAETDRQSVYHYLALLHNYNKNYDSSEYYYQQQVDRGTVSWNNYGTLKMELGNFLLAKEFLDRDKYKYQTKMLREPFYYLPTLYVFAGQPKEAISLTKEAINYSGSTPGFGWYTIAMGRGYLYDGQLDSAEYELNKAAEFKEIHIGTTLTQSQYDFTINLLKLELVNKKMAEIKFLDAGWWYSPSALFDIAGLKVDKMMLEYVIINQMSANPERDRTIYDLFSSESTTTFDEAWFLLRDFSRGYFIKKYKDKLKTDKRENVQRYFKLITYQLQFDDGDEADALTGMKDLYNNVVLDTSAEKLFMGRLYQGLYNANKEEGNDDEALTFVNKLAETYPQLVPYIGCKPKIRLTTSGLTDENTAKVIKELKAANIDWVEDGSDAGLSANILFNKKGETYEATINLSGRSKPIVTNQKILFSKNDGVGKEMVLRLFGKGGALKYEKVSGF